MRVALLGVPVARGAHASRASPPPPPALGMQGLINNSPYVICLALATEISSGGVGLVYLSAILPTIVVKGTVSLVRAGGGGFCKWGSAVPSQAAPEGTTAAAGWCSP
jgi:hypothetical protein